MELFPLFQFMPNFQAVPSPQSPAALQEGSVTEGKSLLGLRVAGTLPSLVKPGRGALAMLAGQGCRWLGSSPFHMVGSQAFLPTSRSHRFPPRPCSQHHRLGLCSSCTGSPVDTRFFFSGAGVGHFKNAAVNF